MPYTIGIFDSGLGGLTVMREITAKLPHADLVYFGDTARVPYGEKSPDTIIRYSIENTAFLESKGVDLIVVACNTASAYALDTLAKQTHIPVLGVIKPGAEHAARTTKNGRIAVIGTRGTIRSGIYEKEIMSCMSQAHVTASPCPLFVPLAEEGFESHPAAHLIANEYLKPLISKDVDTLLLGCTHYPLLKPLIQEVVGDEITIVDSANSCAECILERYPELNSQACDVQGSRHFYVSDDPARFKALGERFLRQPIEAIEESSLLYKL